MRSRFMIVILFAAVLVLGVAACRSSADQNAKPNEESPPETQPEKKEEPAKGEPANGGRYRIDAAQSRFTASIDVGGLFSAFGHPHTVDIRDFNGDVQFTPDSSQPASLRMTVRAGTLSEVGKDFSEKDRQGINRAIRDEALEVAKYPDIVFKSTNISVTKAGEGRYQAKISGSLTLHGATHPVSFPAQVSMKGNVLHASGGFTILHSAYNMKRLSGGGGTVKAKDPIKLSFEIAANAA